MTLAKPPAGPQLSNASGGASRNLLLRIASALVLAPVAVSTAYWGGIPFVLFWLAAAAAVLWEWLEMAGAHGRRKLFALVFVALCVAAIFLIYRRPIAATSVVLLGMLASAIFAHSEHRKWIIAGAGYSGALLLSSALLRLDDQYGFTVIVFLFAVVWTTDIAAYFTGRAIGGPKLAPSISPGKTWSGAFGGIIAAVIVAVFIARYFVLADIASVLLVAFCLSAVSQFGDLLESAIKRRFNVKDASHLIPGHGGVMDRLDGFWAAALFGVVVGILRGGFDESARGLMVW